MQLLKICNYLFVAVYWLCFSIFTGKNHASLVIFVEKVADLSMLPIAEWFFNAFDRFFH
jgi:hypothetical protein